MKPHANSLQAKTIDPCRPPATLGRRSFLKKSLAASAAAPWVISLEEHALVTHGAAAQPLAAAGAASAAGSLPLGTIGQVKISRLICGGNLISGYAHSRDLIYVSQLLKHYFTDGRIKETWALCEQHGINTMIAFPGDPHAVEVYRQYRAEGGRIQYLAQIGPSADDLRTAVKEAVDSGAVGAFLVGNLGDEWTRSGAVGRIGELLGIVKDHGLIAGVAGHELRTPRMVEQAGFAPDFYVKTLHNTNYWSRRQPGQNQEVIDNYGIDNYWCLDPQETIGFMSNVERPWIAYKVLAAGAIAPRSGFKFAFENGADFAAVGMFDFQVAEDVAVAKEVLSSRLDRQRDWMA
ncbi:MAG: hypothetical protein FJ387_23320 [Verrucomicrobia bacterium]|nr:hypothetical protein [Verrucomicrobiota bacterium]